ncbi:hypothetical protein B7P33_07850, partial [Sediminicola luteus]
MNVSGTAPVCFVCPILTNASPNINTCEDSQGQFLSVQTDVSEIDIEFRLFNSQVGNPYSGGTPLGSAVTPSGSPLTATSTVGISGLAPGTYYAYAILDTDDPDLTDSNCRPFEEILIVIDSKPSIDIPNQEICDSTTSVNLTVLEPDGQTGGVWSNGDGDLGDATAADPTTGPFTYTYTDANGCVGSDEVTYTILQELEAEAGEDQTICSGATVSLSGNPSPGMWSTAGDGTFDDASSATAVYTPGANDISGGTVVLTWTTEDPSGPCVGDSDTMTVTINEELVAEAGDDQTICSGATVSLTGSPSPGMWSTAGDGTFDNASSATAVYTPGANDISGGTVVLTWTTEDPSGPCVGDSDTMTVTINEELVAEAGDDQTICSGGMVSLTGNPSPGMWSTAGDGTFDNASSATAVYTPGANDISGGTVVLTWTTEDPTGPCVGDSDTMTVIINEELVAEAGEDQTICSGGMVSLTGNPSPGMWSTAGDGTFDNASSATAVYTPGANDISGGTVVLTWTTENPSGPCVGDSDTMTVTINEELVAEAGDDQTICSGGMVSLTGNPSPGMWSTAGDGTFD